MSILFRLLLSLLFHINNYYHYYFNINNYYQYYFNINNYYHYYSILIIIIIIILMMTIIIIIIIISIIKISNSQVFWIKNQAYSLSHHKDFSHQYKHSRHFNLIYYCLGGRDVIDPSSVEAPIEVKKVRHMNRKRVWTWIWMLMLMLMLMRHAVDVL